MSSIERTITNHYLESSSKLNRIEKKMSLTTKKLKVKELTPTTIRIANGIKKMDVINSLNL